MRIKLSISGINEIGQRCGIFEFEQNIKLKKELPKIIEDAICQYKNEHGQPSKIVDLHYIIYEMVVLETNEINL